MANSKKTNFFHDEGCVVRSGRREREEGERLFFYDTMAGRQKLRHRRR